MATKLIETKADLDRITSELGIITDTNIRWETGIDHHPKSEALMKALMTVDMIYNNDYFCWKKGGDGDNGETLMYTLDIIFELEDAGFTVSERAWQ